MHDIFLSYAGEDRSRAGQLADALGKLGWKVWWDRTILPGKTFDKVIESELSAATCVIVLWSKTSVESQWVRAEARWCSARSRQLHCSTGTVTWIMPVSYNSPWLSKRLLHLPR
jgi:hypothetical protein